MSTLAEDARALTALNEEYTAVSKVRAELKEQRDNAERALMERMEIEEVSSLTTGDRKFLSTGTRYANIQDRAAFVAWAEENDPSLLKTEERGGPLSELVRERLDNNEELPPGVGWHLKQFISQTAA